MKPTYVRCRCDEAFKARVEAQANRLRISTSTFVYWAVEDYVEEAEARSDTELGNRVQGRNAVRIERKRRP